jgi:hypothetical protein
VASQLDEAAVGMKSYIRAINEALPAIDAALVVVIPRTKCK